MIILLFFIFLNLYNTIHFVLKENIFNSINNQNNITNRGYTELDIFSPQFYLTEKVRINTTFMIGTSQKVIYLNYPFTFTNNPTINMMKNANTSGIIILKDQPAGITSSNFSNMTSITPIAYFTVQPIPLGWQIYSPADYFSHTTPTLFSFYSNNIYIGKNVGPNHDGYNNLNLENLLYATGTYNIAIGNNSGNFPENKLFNYNTIIGSWSGNDINGSFNSIFGAYHGSKNILNTTILNQDYYSGNNFFNYNNSFGFGNYNSTKTTGGSPRLTTNKQNNIFGNLNFSSVNKGFRNCIFGNRILSTIVDNIVQFTWIDSNIMIGNNIFYQVNNSYISGLYGNIFLIPNGDQLISGGIDMSIAFSPYDDNLVAQSNYSIMIGSCGLPIPYSRSYKTFIGNIYNSSLTEEIPSIKNNKKLNDLGFIGKTSFPVTTMTSNADQLGQIEILPYGNVNDYETEPGNVLDVSFAANFLLDPDYMPVIGVAFSNTTEAAKNGLVYTIDVYRLIKSPIIGKNNPLQSFVIYKTQKNLVPYPNESAYNVNNQFTIYSDPKICGYEHYYLIPIIVKACQILNDKINNITSKVTTKIKSEHTLKKLYTELSTQYNELKNELNIKSNEIEELKIKYKILEEMIKLYIQKNDNDIFNKNY